MSFFSPLRRAQQLRIVGSEAEISSQNLYRIQRIKLIFTGPFDFIAEITGLAAEISTELDRGLARGIVL